MFIVIKLVSQFPVMQVAQRIWNKRPRDVVIVYIQFTGQYYVFTKYCNSVGNTLCTVTICVYVLLYLIVSNILCLWGCLFLHQAVYHPCLERSRSLGDIFRSGSLTYTGHFFCLGWSCRPLISFLSCLPPSTSPSLSLHVLNPWILVFWHVLLSSLLLPWFSSLLSFSYPPLPTPYYFVSFTNTPVGCQTISE